MAKKKFYVTTPIYYPNDIPHIGHAYTTIAADVLARWNKILGKDVFFLTGTDDHGKKIADTAEKAKLTPKQFTDKLVPTFKDAWKKLNVEYDRFIRTTDKDHEKLVQEILQKVFDKGDIYLGEYEGYYCTGCEAYYTEKDLEDGCCPIHKNKIEKLKEESYFFRLSKYQDKLLQLYEKHPEFILPDHRRNEIINRVKEGLNDLSISRTSFDWGIKLPFDKKHICYVWFDALFNYYSGVNEKSKQKYWPADAQLIGKDILWFHTVYWPAFLISAGIKLPKTVFAHGWWTFGKEKISKSRGKIINVDELISIAGVDSARYFLFREGVFGEDSDFSEQSLIDRHNNELANKLGNLVSRVSSLAEKNGLEKTSNKLIKKLDLEKIEKLISGYELDKVLNEIFGFVDICNEFIQKNKIWETKDKKKLYELVDSIKTIAILLWPFIPETSEKIAKHFGFKIDFKEIKKPFQIKKIKKSEVLFKKIEAKINKSEKEKKEINLFSIEPQLKEKGISAKIAVINNVHISNKDAKLEGLKKESVKKIFEENNEKDKEILKGYREFYKDNKEGFKPAAESLRMLIKKNKRYPNINTLVDIYNLVSAESLLSVGAHDLSKIEGEISFIITNGSENFIPLGSNQTEKVKSGEYAFVDEKEILCRMDVKQSDKTKITKNTKDLIIYVQGNKNTGEDYVKENLLRICELVKKICGGDYKFIEEER